MELGGGQNEPSTSFAKRLGIEGVRSGVVQGGRSVRKQEKGVRTYTVPSQCPYLCAT